MPRFKKIKQQKDQGNNAVVDAISQKWIRGCGQEFKVPAKQNECSNMPTHDKHSDGHTNKAKTDWGNISEIFWRQVQRIGAKCLHENSINSAEEYKPEKEQNLVSPEMQEDQLYRQ
jgi:hypothetical protein